MNVDLNGEVAFVTGGGKNIGGAVSQALAACGVSVACGYQHDAESSRRTVERIRGQRGTAKEYRLDLAEPSDVDETLGRIRDDLGDVSIVVNNAAVRPRQPIAQVEQDDWDNVQAINLRAPFFIAKNVLPGMRRNGWGRIVNISGIDAYQGENQRPHVIASKLGLVGLTRALALEVATWGVTVNAVVPGHIETVRDHPEWYPDLERTTPELLSRIPAARAGTVDEVASAVLYLCSREAAYVTGHEIVVAGGCFPLTRQPWYEY